MRVSFIIPVFNNFKYTKHVYENLKEYYPDDEIVISDGGSNDDTLQYFKNINDDKLILLDNGLINLSQNYNSGVLNSTSEISILLHNDMFIPPNFKDKLLKGLTKDNIMSYSRIEPPIFSLEEPGKIVRDFGYGLEDIRKDLIINFTETYESEYNGGGYLFIACYKKNWIGLDEHTYHPPQMWSADDDLHRRYKLTGLELKISSACVYHFVSKTSRIGDTQVGETNSRRSFLRKWGSMNSQNRFNIGFVVENCTEQLLELLEPWCNCLYYNNINDPIGVYKQNYENQEQPTTCFDLNKRIKHTSSEKVEDIIVSFDGSKLSSNNFEIIKNLQNILGNVSPQETYNIDIFDIKVNTPINYIQDLIKI